MSFSGRSPPNLGRCRAQASLTMCRPRRGCSQGLRLYVLANAAPTQSAPSSRQCLEGPTRIARGQPASVEGLEEGTPTSGEPSAE